VDEVMFPVSILRYTSDHQPGFVVCEFRDAHGRVYTSREVKQVYVSDAYLDESTPYPVPGLTECVVLRIDGSFATVRFTRLTWEGIDVDDHPFEIPAALLPVAAPDAEPGAAADGGGM